jgi:hypothetical protein
MLPRLALAFLAFLFALAVPALAAERAYTTPGLGSTPTADLARVGGPDGVRSVFIPRAHEAVRQTETTPGSAAWTVTRGQPDALTTRPVSKYALEQGVAAFARAETSKPVQFRPEPGVSFVDCSNGTCSRGSCPAVSRVVRPAQNAPLARTAACASCGQGRVRLFRRR